MCNGMKINVTYFIADEEEDDVDGDVEGEAEDDYEDDA